jgi:hypothetical protein
MPTHINRKSYNFYTEVARGKNATNGQPFVDYVIYRGADGEWFVREATEFDEKFEKLKNPQCAQLPKPKRGSESGH